MLTLAKKKLTKREKTRSSNVGRWARVMWDDVGSQDGILVEKREHGSRDNCSFKVFFPYDRYTSIVEVDQIVSLGKHVEAKNSGL
jgi:hypothetical protein